VRELTEVVRRVADGDLSARLVSRSRDEVGTLTRDFGVMAERLRTTIEDLRHERSESAAILERMADGIVIVDPHGLVHLINPAAQRFLATTFEEAAGRSLPQVAREEQIVELARASLREGRPQSGLVEIPRRDLLLNVIAAPLPSEALEGSSMLVLQDLSEVRRLETVRRDFGSDVSHELRTPLASLRALVDTLRGGAIDDPPAAARFLERMDTEIDDLTQMVEELLTLSRIESGQAPVRLAPMPVADLIAPVLDRLTPQVERGRLSLSVSLPEDLPRVLADDDQVSQALTNIVQNAIKFTPDGGSIVVSARPEGDQVVISVRDTGIGIAPDVLPRVFERFFKADQSRASHGTGLGLAIAKHVVQAHGGRIWAESVQGQGSTFSFTLATEPATRT
jgi:two-component system phosphate regulon sensor histidine kinase PhoR